MSKNIIRILLVLLSIPALSACGGSTPTLSPITPVSEEDVVVPTPLPQLDPRTLSQDTRDCYVPSPGYEQFVSLEHGYCLVYPGNFEVLHQDDDPRRVAFAGPEHTSGSQPIRATLTIDIRPAGSATFEEAYNALLDSYPDADTLNTSVTIHEQPAEILENIPGEISMRQAITLANQRIFTLTLTPAEEDFPTAQPDSDQVWSSVLATLRFFTPESPSASTGALDTSVWAVTEFTGLGMRFLLPPDWQVNPLPDAFALAPREHSVTDWIVLRTYPDLPAGEIATLVEALKTRFQDQGVAYNNLLTRDFNGIQALSVMGEVGLCQDHYVPAFGLVHQIAVHPSLCNESGEITDEVTRAILDTISFFEATQ
jgi:hypothetical protein